MTKHKQEVVKIANSASDSGFCYINQCDYDPAIHVLFDVTNELNRNQTTSNNPRNADSFSDLDLADSGKLLAINLNTATEKELVKVPTIGKVTATKITKRRPFETIEQAQEALSSLVKWEEVFSDYEVTV